MRSNRGKGAGVWWSTGLDAAVAQLGVRWVYAWSPFPESHFQKVPAGVELVPMIATMQENTPKSLASVVSKGYKHLLGFNEPELFGPISVADAVAAWPKFVKTGLRVGSPGCANTRLRPGD